MISGVHVAYGQTGLNKSAMLEKGFLQHFDSSSPFGQWSTPSHHWEALRHLPLFPQDFPTRHWYHTGREHTGDMA